MSSNFIWPVLQFDARDVDAFDDEPSRFVHVYTGTIALFDDKDEGGDNLIRAGSFAATVIDVCGALAQNESVFDVFDSYGETLAYYEDLYAEDELGVQLKPSVVEVACGKDYLWSPNLLSIDHVLLLPEYRRRGLGRAAVAALIHELRPGVGVVITEPRAIQCLAAANKSSELQRTVHEYRLDEYTCAESDAIAKIERTFRKVGFKRLPGTGYLVLDTDRLLPEAEELLKRGAGSKRSVRHLPPLRKAQVLQFPTRGISVRRDDEGEPGK